MWFNPTEHWSQAPPSGPQPVRIWPKSPQPDQSHLHRAGRVAGIQPKFDRLAGGALCGLLGRLGEGHRCASERSLKWGAQLLMRGMSSPAPETSLSGTLWVPSIFCHFVAVFGSEDVPSPGGWALVTHTLTLYEASCMPKANFGRLGPSLADTTMCMVLRVPHQGRPLVPGIALLPRRRRTPCRRVRHVSGVVGQIGVESTTFERCWFRWVRPDLVSLRLKLCCDLEQSRCGPAKVCEGADRAALPRRA